MKRYVYGILTLGLAIVAFVLKPSGEQVVLSHPRVTVQVQTAKPQPAVIAPAEPVRAAASVDDVQLLTQWRSEDPSSEARTAAMETLVSGAAPVERLLALQLRLPEAEREDFLTAATEALVAHHPQAAGQLAEAIGTSEALGTVALLWAQQDAPSAAAWSLQQATAAPEIIAPLISRWAETDPMAASQWLVTLPSGPARDAGVILLLPQLLADDPEAAAAWIQSLADPIAREGMAAQLANTLAVDQPGAL